MCDPKDEGSVFKFPDGEVWGVVSYAVDYDPETGEIIRYFVEDPPVEIDDDD